MSDPRPADDIQLTAEDRQDIGRLLGMKPTEIRSARYDGEDLLVTTHDLSTSRITPDRAVTLISALPPGERNPVTGLPVVPALRTPAELPQPATTGTPAEVRASQIPGPAPSSLPPVVVADDTGLVAVSPATGSTVPVPDFPDDDPADGDADPIDPATAAPAATEFNGAAEFERVPEPAVDVERWVAVDPDARAQRALDAELARRTPRSGLLAKLRQLVERDPASGDGAP